MISAEARIDCFNISATRSDTVMLIVSYIVSAIVAVAVAKGAKG
ncbi:MAG: hypothetical protein WCD69_13595 [Xanthobacteraceae bacterium]